MTRIQLIALMAVVTLGIIVVANVISPDVSLREGSVIDPTKIESYMQQQVDIGPRYPGSNGSIDFVKWIVNQVPDGWDITFQNFTIYGIKVHNLMFTSSTSTEWPSILIGAHWDTRKVADQDKQNPDYPVIGANDGASGVAAILEMMRHVGFLKDHIGFVLFDAEDQGYGGMSGWSYIMGSEYFASQMTEDQVSKTDVFILYDMIANDQLNLKYEYFSTKDVKESIWSKASDLGYGDIFKKQVGPSLIDDHKPFLSRGIPAVDLIDFSYPEWHTTKDDMDHVSPEAAGIVVDVVLSWLQDEYSNLQPSSTATTEQVFSSTTETRPSPIDFNLIAVSILLVTIIRWKSNKVNRY